MSPPVLDKLEVKYRVIEMVLLNEANSREILKTTKDYSAVKAHTCMKRYKTPTKIVGFCDYGGQRIAKDTVTEKRMAVSEFRGKSWVWKGCLQPLCVMVSKVLVKKAESYRAVRPSDSESWGLGWVPMEELHL